jgi:tetratricopeptide (TPR) repeat protein
MDHLELRDFVDRYFDDNELRELCFDLGVDYESLPAAGKSARARELVTYCQRRNRLPELEAACRRLRPNAFQGAPAVSAGPTSAATEQPAGTVVNQSGGVTIHAQTVNIGGDVTGRDKGVAEGSTSPTPPAPPPPPSDLRAAPPQSEDQFEYDVFISYRTGERDWVRRELLPQLERYGLKACIDYRDFRPGRPVVDELERAVTTSRKTLLILTAEYSASGWTSLENQMLQALDAEQQQHRLIPLLKERCELPLRIRYITYVNFVDPDDWDGAWRQLLTALGARPIQETAAKETPSSWNLVHPYGMPPNFTGRLEERAMLTQWLTQDAAQSIAQHPLLVIRALGGFGKSALAWHWLLNDVNATQWPRAVWWSFYEGDASFEHFLSDTLKYLKIETQGLGPRQQADALLQVLQRPGTLLVLDGFERQLRAFSSLNAAYQGDAEATPTPSPLAHRSANSNGTGEGVNDTDCISPCAERFLLGLAVLTNLRGKVLMTTRLCPRILQTRGGELLQGCVEKELTQMQPADAVAFFRAQGVRGSRAEIEAACAPYGYHPLSLRLLAGLILGDLQQPGDIAVATRLDVSGDQVQRQHHVLKQAYDTLTPARQMLLSHIACFRSAVSYEALQALSTTPQHPERSAASGAQSKDAGDAKPRFSWFKRKSTEPHPSIAQHSDASFDDDLHDLLARGLLHRDEKNRYDLHPIVRRYAYDRLTASDRTAAHAQLRDYFAAVPAPSKVQTLDDLQPVIELYHHTVRAGQYDEARTLMRDRLIPNPLYFQFGAYQLCIELLRALFPGGEDRPPLLKDETAQAWTLTGLANSYSLSGQPRRAVSLFEQHNALQEKAGDKKNLAIGLGNVASQQMIIGALRAAEANLRCSIDLCREIEDEFPEAVGHEELGRLLAYRGLWAESEQELATAQAIFEKQSNVQGQGINWAYRALRALLMARTSPSTRAEPPARGALLEGEGSALFAARRALELADEDARTDYPVERDYVRAHWLLGAAYRLNGDLAQAEQHLSEALTRCRNINNVEHEAEILLDLARLRVVQNEREEALRLAEEALLITERSEYVLQGADVHLLMAQLDLDAGDKRAAFLHAREARRLATCDGASVDGGPDYVYKVAYDEAGELLKELG